MDAVLALILGGGRGAGLYPLTKLRSTPAVPVAGKYRLIDIPISNCINSGLNRIYVLTQFLSVSLHRHIANTYKFAPFTRGFVEVLAAQQTNETADWFRGTADAVRQNLRYLKADRASDVVMLAADGLYRMNFREVLGAHRNHHADVTVVLLPVRRDQAPFYGVARLDGDNRLTDLVEKPRAPEALDALRLPEAWLRRRGLAGTGKEYLANTGIYVCKRDYLFDMLQARPQAVDLVTELFAPSLHTHRVQAHLFDGYWEDLGTVKAYHQANLALAGDDPPFDFHVPDGIIYTRMRNLPASRVLASAMRHCLVSDGCLIGPGTHLERCVIGLRTRVGRDAVLRDTVVIGADRFETEAERAANRRQGLPNLGVGDGAVIERAILDKDVRVGARARLVNERGLREADGDNYVIRDGIVVIPRGAVIPEGAVI